MENCGRCGARLAPGSEWCNQCYATTAPHEAAAAETRAPILPSFWMPEEPVPPPVYSRWHAGVTTFGPVGRILSTIIVVAPAVVWFFVMKAAGFVFGLTGFVGYCVVGVVVLRQIWKRDRIH